MDMIADAIDFAFKVKNPPWVRIAIPAAVLIAIGVVVFVLARKR